MLPISTIPDPLKTWLSLVFFGLWHAQSLSCSKYVPLWIGDRWKRRFPTEWFPRSWDAYPVQASDDSSARVYPEIWERARSWPYSLSYRCTNAFARWAKVQIGRVLAPIAASGNVKGKDLSEETSDRLLQDTTFPLLSNNSNKLQTLCWCINSTILCKGRFHLIKNKTVHKTLLCWQIFLFYVKSFFILAMNLEGLSFLIAEC